MHSGEPILTGHLANLHAVIAWQCADSLRESTLSLVMAASKRRPDYAALNALSEDVANLVRLVELAASRIGNAGAELRESILNPVT